MIDLAKEVPATCQLDGFDISPDLFPSRDGLPENVKLHIADAKAAVDPKYSGKFDVINIRYLTGGMKLDDWQTVLHNMYKILKPGGRLQWLEPNLLQACHWTQGNLTAPSSAQELADLLLPALQLFEYPCKELAGLFRTAGFQNVVHEMMSSDRIPETRRAWAECNFSPMSQALLMTQRRKGADGYSPEDCAKLMDKIRAEADAGIIYSRFDLHLFVGQKP